LPGGHRTQPMPAATAFHLEIVIGIVLLWLAIGAVGLLRPIQGKWGQCNFFAS